MRSGFVWRDRIRDMQRERSTAFRLSATVWVMFDCQVAP